MGKLTLILGGARSGKSTLAEKLAKQRGNRVIYVATAVAFDDEMATRIKNHRGKRPQSWITVETPTGISEAVQDHLDETDVILLDCLTLLVNNLFMKISGDPNHLDEAQFAAVVEAEIEAILQVIEGSPVAWIIVSNEVGMGLVPPYPLGRVYRDLLGYANQRLAAIADEVYLMVAGIGLPLHQVGMHL